MVNEVEIALARAEDAGDLAVMMEAFAVEDGEAPGVFDREKVLRDGFGPDPAFEALIARAGGTAVGYALYFPAYNTEVGARALFMNDLWVAPDYRSARVGRRLMAALAAHARDGGYVAIWWGVRNKNTRGLRFYAALGAKDDDARILELDGAPLARLAAEATADPV